MNIIIEVIGAITCLCRKRFGTFFNFQLQQNELSRRANDDHKVVTGLHFDRNDANQLTNLAKRFCEHTCLNFLGSSSQAYRFMKKVYDIQVDWYTYEKMASHMLNAFHGHN